MATTKADTTTETKAKTDPVGKASEPTKVQPLDIPANEPYPTGSPPDPEDAFFAAHGYRRAKEG